MSQLNKYKNQASPEKLYYDIQIANIESTSVNPPAVYFNESRNTPFLQCPEDYYMSIIRFTLDTQTLPIFIPTIQTNPSINPTGDLNQTIYSFQFSYNGVFSDETFIEWSPQSIYLEAPQFITQDGLVVQNNSTGYYYCYTFEYFVALINQQLLASFDNFIAQNPNLLPPTAVAPVFAWDGSANIARIMFEESFLTTNATPVYFYMNAPLYNLFGSFNALRLGYNAQGRNMRFIVENYAGFNSYQYTNYITGDTYNVIESIQEYPTISAWSPISSIVFTSNTLPIVSNQVSKPTVYVEGGILGNYGNNSNFAQIITDMVTDDSFYKPNIVYNPTAEYRLIELMGNTPLTNFDISIFWKDKVGRLTPFYLGSGGTATLKVLFTKKGTMSKI
jgi:hypothetical protein